MHTDNDEPDDDFRPGNTLLRKRRIEEAHLKYFEGKVHTLDVMRSPERKKIDLEIELLKLQKRSMLIDIFNKEHDLVRYQFAV